jgi:hypothetical protein
MYSGNSETSKIVNNQCVSCQGGLADTKVFTDNRSTPAEGLKCGVDVTTTHKPCGGLCRGRSVTPPAQRQCEYWVRLGVGDHSVCRADLINLTCYT